MNEKDNLLLEQFFREAASQQLEDEGFSRRVMQEIERTTLQERYSHLWTLFCIVVAIVVFVASQGWTTLGSYAMLYLTNAEVMLHSLPAMLDLSVWLTHLPTILLSLVVMMALTVIGLMRWAIRQAW